MEPVKIPKVEITKSRVLNGVRIFEILIAFSLYILGDYVQAKFTPSFITDKAYWINVFTDLVLVVAFMMTVRSLRKTSQINKSTEICDAMTQIRKGYNIITVNGFSTKLDEYLVKLNEQNKYETFLKNTRAEIIRLTDIESSFRGKFYNKQKLAEKRKKLDADLNLSREEILKKNIKYKKVTISKLFSSVDGKVLNENEFDLDTYETQDVAKMVELKALLVVLFCSITGTLVVNFFYYGISAVYSTLIKIFSFLMATNTAMNVADDFVQHNVRISVLRRLKHLAGFVNETPELKDLLNNTKKD